MIKDEEIRSKVVEVISNKLCQDNIKGTDLLVKDLGADSLDLVEIVIDLEKAFSITIPDDDYPVYNTTVDDVVDYIIKHTND